MGCCAGHRRRARLPSPRADINALRAWRLMDLGQTAAQVRVAKPVLRAARFALRVLAPIILRVQLRARASSYSISTQEGPVAKIAERSEIAVEFKWDLTAIYPSDEAWLAASQALTARLVGVARFQGCLGESPDLLADWLEEWQALRGELGRLYTYATCQQALDTTDATAAAHAAQASALFAQVIAALAFAEPELLQVGVAHLQAWAAEHPRLATYRHYFDALGRRAAHVRSSEVEELLGQVLDPFHTAGQTHGILADADLTFAPARDSAGVEWPVAQGTIDALLTSPDREARRTAYLSYADAHLALRHSMANCLSANVKQDVFMAQARRYPTALEAALSANHIPAAVYGNVVDTFRHNLPVWHRYWRLRQRVLGVERLQPWDVRAPLANDGPRIPYAQAVEWICAGMAPLGEDYVEAMCHGLRHEHWVDVYANRGKTAGAFSSGSQGTPPLILMSYTDDVYSLSTLAHELGHSLHSLLTWRTQPFIYSDYSIFVAEVASNLNQALVREHLLERNPERSFQIALIEESLSNYYRYFFLMPTLARFELAIHQAVEAGQGLTAEGMTDVLADLFAEGFGDEVVMDRERVGITWAEFSTHLYADFYVYQYTTGIAAAHALAARVLAGQPGAVASYLQFLQAGDSLYPLEALQLAGIDMSRPEPIQQAFDELDRLVARLEALFS